MRKYVNVSTLKVLKGLVIHNYSLSVLHKKTSWHKHRVRPLGDCAKYEWTSKSVAQTKSCLHWQSICASIRTFLPLSVKVFWRSCIWTWNLNAPKQRPACVRCQSVEEVSPFVINTLPSCVCFPESELSQQRDLFETAGAALWSQRHIAN